MGSKKKGQKEELYWTEKSGEQEEGSKESLLLNEKIPESEKSQKGIHHSSTAIDEIMLNTPMTINFLNAFCIRYEAY
ncbi:hypothetical protein BTS2_2043 [Bacillus sp. TS-2]|nr:hypothetical protein BTS2_2043 [Bacillus sp. TS-2]